MSLSPEGYQEKKGNGYGIYSDDITLNTSSNTNNNVNNPYWNSTKTENTEQTTNSTYHNTSEILSQVDIIKQKLIVKFMIRTVITFIVLTLSFYFYIKLNDEKETEIEVETEDPNYILVDTDGDGTRELHRTNKDDSRESSEDRKTNLSPLLSALLLSLAFMILGKIAFAPINSIKAKISICEGYTKALKDMNL